MGWNSGQFSSRVQTTPHEPSPEPSLKKYVTSDISSKTNCWAYMLITCKTPSLLRLRPGGHTRKHTRTSLHSKLFLSLPLTMSLKFHHGLTIALVYIKCNTTNLSWVLTWVSLTEVNYRVTKLRTILGTSFPQTCSRIQQEERLVEASFKFETPLEFCKHTYLGWK